MAELPILTNNAIHRILSGEYILKPVLQVISSAIVERFGWRCIKLMLSDGNFYHHAFVVPPPNQLNRLCQNAKLFHIVRFESFKLIDALHPRLKPFIVLDHISIFRSGDKANRLIGNPLCYATDETPERTVTEAIFSSETVHSILSRKQVQNPVLQVIGSKIEGNGLKLKVADARYYCRTCYIPYQKIHEANLKVNTIFRLEGWWITDYQSANGDKISGIFPNEYTVLSSGEKLERTIEDLHDYYADNTKPKWVSDLDNLEPSSSELSLTNNAIQRILSGENLIKPVLQILSAEISTNYGRPCVKLLLSDGNYCNHFYYYTAIKFLSSHYESFKPFSILCLDSYVFKMKKDVNHRGKSDTFLLGTTILKSGDKAVGKPICYSTNKQLISKAEQSPFKQILSINAIHRMLASLKIVDKPVLQIISSEIREYYGRQILRLELSDSKYSHFGLIAPMPHQLEQYRAILHENAILRVNKYQPYIYTSDGEERILIVLEECTVLKSGDKVRCRIGNPKDYMISYPSRQTTFNHSKVFKWTKVCQPSSTCGDLSRHCKLMQRSSMKIVEVKVLKINSKISLRALINYGDECRYVWMSHEMIQQLDIISKLKNFK